jgi:hypothetical protein
MRAVAALAAVCAAAVACGSHEPRLKRVDAAPLISLTQRIAREGPCARRRDLSTLRTRAIALVNRHAVPSALQEPFVSAVNELASHAVTCAPGTESTVVKEQARDLSAWLEKNSR